MTNNNIVDELIALHKEIIDISSKLKALDTRMCNLVIKLDKECDNRFTKCELINPILKADLDSTIKYDIDKFIKWVTGDDSISKFKVDSQLELLKAKCKSKEEENNTKSMSEEDIKENIKKNLRGSIIRFGSAIIDTNRFTSSKRDIKDIMDEI